jgi:hypothetical protein
MKETILKLMNATVLGLAVPRDVRNLAARLALRAERGDADSAGSTLRTVFVLAVVAAVLTLLGPAIRAAAQEALGYLGTR